ncbi:MAG: peptidoglycan DD-metalloendopeptidase family protein [Proteobacteria bacterium]|nr:peptidoglycan DD-metalloendopeptidase family protein [Pseudomonadota bacterium]
MQGGERLRAIAARLRVPLDDLEELNGVSAADPLTPGQRLFVPAPAHASSSPRARATPPAPTTLPITLAWPLQGGRLTSGFGLREGRVHEGIDLAAPAGTPVLAAAPGLVIYVGSGLRGYGNLILLRHRGGMVTVYAHNRRNHVRQGQQVRSGEVIAEVGRSGRASANHLHFELRRGEEPIDPAPHLPQR